MFCVYQALSEFSEAVASLGFKIPSGCRPALRPAMFGRSPIRMSRSLSVMCVACVRFVSKMVTRIRFLSLWWPSGLSWLLRKTLNDTKWTPKIFKEMSQYFVADLCQKLLRGFAFCPFGNHLVFLGLARKTTNITKRTQKISPTNWGQTFVTDLC